MGEIFAHDRLNNVACDRAPLTEREVETSLLKPKDLLFARQSLVLSGAGKCTIFVGDREPVTFESHIIRVRLNPALTEPYFFYYLFRSDVGRSLIESIVEQGAGASGIRGSDLQELLVPLPPLPEQRAIASILGALDDKIDLNRRMNETLEAMARAIFKSWFVDFDPVRAKAEGKQPFGMDADTAALFPDRLVDSEIGPIPEGWEVSALGNLCDLVKDKTEPEDVDPETSYVGLEHIPKRTFGMLETGVAADVSSAKARFSAGDTLFGKLRPYFHKVVPAFTDGICSTDILVLRPKSAVHSAAALLTASLDACVEYATQYSTGTRMPRANWKDLAKFPIAMSVDLLPLFARQADTKLKLIARNVEQSRTLAELRDLLLPKLLSGEIRVKDAEKAMEAAI